MGHAQLFHERHGDDGEGFVDFPQVHVFDGPAGFGQRFLGGAHRRGGEPLRRLGVGGVADDAGQRRAAQFGGGAGAHEQHGGCAVVDGRAGGGGDGPVFFEGGAQAADFVELDFAGAFVDGHHALTAAVFHSDRRDLGSKRTGLGGDFGALHAGGGKGILLGAGEAVFGGAVFAEGAHAAAGFVGVFQAVEHHVVINFVAAHAVAAAAFEQQVGGVGHAFHATGYQHLVRTRQQHVVAKHGRAHARAAHLGQRHRARALRQAAFERRLARRGLALAGHQAVAE